MVLTELTYCGPYKIATYGVKEDPGATDISDYIPGYPFYSYFGSKIEDKLDNLTFKCRPMKDIQINRIVQSLEMEDWRNLLTTDANINTVYDNFITKLLMHQ